MLYLPAEIGCEPYEAVHRDGEYEGQHQEPARHGGSPAKEKEPSSGYETQYHSSRQRKGCCLFVLFYQ